MMQKQTFSDKQKPREFTSNRPAVQEKLKQNLQAKVYETTEKHKSTQINEEQQRHK